MIKQLAKKLALLLLHDYGIYRIYRAPQVIPPVELSFEVQEIDASWLAASGDPLLAEQAWYCGSDSRAFGVIAEGRLLAACFYWWGERYRRERAFLELGPHEAKLVQIVTLASARGRGLARGLIAESARRMQAGGMTELFARVWHSNDPSRRAFECAGWRAVGWVVEINPLRRTRPWRIRWAATARSSLPPVG